MNKKLERLALRALEEVQLDMELFSCTLLAILQDKLEAPEKPLRPVLLRTFETEEPLAWSEWKLPELSVVVKKEKGQLLFLDTESGDKLLVLPIKELKDE